MSKAGPTTRSRSKRNNVVGSATGAHQRANHDNAPSLEIKVPQLQEYEPRQNSDDIIIGLALGSPGQTPPPPMPWDDKDVGVSRDVDVSYIRNSPERRQVDLGTVTEIGSGGQHARKKGNRWRSLGGIFGKRDSGSRVQEAPPFYQLDKVPEQQSVNSPFTQDHSEAKTLRRKRADSSRSKTEMDSSQSTTKGNYNGLLRRNSSRKKGLRQRKFEETKPEVYRQHNKLPTHAEVENPEPPPAVLRRPMASLLQVEIPNVELDRYSVMFGDLLNSKPQPRTRPGREPLRLSPRQTREEGQLPGLESRDDRQGMVDHLLQPPHRRDDSASSKSSKTPSFSLFPASNTTPRQSANSAVNKPLPTPSPLGRSTTAPNILAPRDRPRIQKSKSEDQDHVFVFVHNSEDLPSTPTSYSRRHSSGPPCPSSNSTRTSFFEFQESSNFVLDLAPSATVSKGADKSLADNTFPARKSSMKKSLQSPEQSTPPIYVENRTSDPAAEISIARQISISRRQQKLLVPVAPKLARQPRQPMLVNGISTPAARKSHHLTLEDG